MIRGPSFVPRTARAIHARSGSWASSATRRFAGRSSTWGWMGLRLSDRRGCRPARAGSPRSRSRSSSCTSARHATAARSTRAALPGVIRAVRARGYRFVTLSGSSRAVGLIAQRVEHDRDRCARCRRLVPRGSPRPPSRRGPCQLALVTERREPVVQLSASVSSTVTSPPAVYAEDLVVQAVEALKLGDRALVVVDPKIDDDVREAGVAGVLLHDEQRCGLLAAAVPSCGLCRGQALDQPLREREVAVCSKVPRARRPSPARPGCSPALLPGAGAAARPVVALRAGEGRRPARGVHHPDLPLGRPSSAEVRASTTSSAVRPSRRSARPSGP